MPISQQIGSSSLAKPGVCTSTTRPATPFEGQMIYETDTDMIALWNGTSWRYIAATTPTYGTVLQVAYGSTSTEAQTTSNSVWTTTNITGTITPRSATSRILIQASIQYRIEDANAGGFGLQLTRNGSAIYSDSGNYGMGYSSNSSGSSARGFFQYLDTPSTTSTLVYLLNARRYATTITSFQDDGVYTSTIVLMEIAA